MEPIKMRDGSLAIAEMVAQKVSETAQTVDLIVNGSGLPPVDEAITDYYKLPAGYLDEKRDLAQQVPAPFLPLLELICTMLPPPCWSITRAASRAVRK